MANLTWFQYEVAVWEAKVRELGLSLEDEGILMRLIRAAWQAPIVGTIADHEDEFARILGAKWKRGLPLIARMFTADEAHPGRLRSDFFAELYARAMTKHMSYVERGGKGGRPKNPEKKPQLPKPEAGGKPQLSIERGSGSEKQSSGSDPLARENKTEGNSCGPADHTAIPPASVDALGAETPRAPSAPAVPDADWQATKDAIFAKMSPEERAAARIRAAHELERLTPKPSLRETYVQ